MMIELIPIIHRGVRHVGGRQRGSKNTKEVQQKIHGIYGNLVFNNAQNKIVRTWQSKPFNRKNIKHGWMPPHPTVFLRKEVYAKHGLFDTSFKNTEYIKDVVVRNCYILMARGGSRVDGHSGFNIICDGPAAVSNILFENINVEKSEIKLFELHITDGTKYGKGPASHITDIAIRNVEWMHEGPIVLSGHDENHQVRNVVFENCMVAGKPLSEVKDKILVKNNFVKSVEIE